MRVFPYSLTYDGVFRCHKDILKRKLFDAGAPNRLFGPASGGGLKCCRWPRETSRFAESSRQCENTFMKKLAITAVTILAAGALLVGNAMAQTPASSPSQAPTAQAPASQAPAAKAPAAAGTSHHATAAKSATPLVLKTDKDKASYALGMNMGKGLQKDAVEIDPNIFARGLKDGLAGGKTLMTEEEATAAINVLKAEVKKNQEAKMQLAGDANKKEGDAFLAANKTKEGVVTLPSGLQYKILTAGDGAKPTAADSVVCNYKARSLMARNSTLLPSTAVRRRFQSAE